MNHFPFDAATARSFGQLAAGLRRAGREPAARAYGAMIAATAISNDLPIHTCNPRDFTDIEELTLVAVPHPIISSALALTPTNPGPADRAWVQDMCAFARDHLLCMPQISL